MKKQFAFLRRFTALMLALCMLTALTAEIFAADIVASGALRMPRREALLLLRHAVGKLGWPASGDALSLRLDDSRLDIAVHARNDMPSTAQRSDTGGLGALAQRLAERIGWRCEQASPGRIVFALPADASDGARTG